MLHLVGMSPWDDDDVLSAIREYVLPELRKKSGDLTLQVDDTGIAWNRFLHSSRECRKSGMNGHL